MSSTHLFILNVITHIIRIYVRTLVRMHVYLCIYVRMYVHEYMFTYVVYCLYSAHSHTSTILFLTFTYVAPMEVSEQYCVLLLLLEDN